MTKIAHDDGKDLACRALRKARLTLRRSPKTRVGWLSWDGRFDAILNGFDGRKSS